MNDSEILVRVENVSKKFCRSLKKSLWYGVKDMAHELNPFGGKAEIGKTEKMKYISACQNSSISDFKKVSASQPVSVSAFHDALRPDEFWAVKDVSFELKRGECLGLIGHNGAGKTTLLKMLNGLIKPDHGRIEMRGRIGALIALGAGFNPILTGRENIYVNGSVLGLTRKEIDRKIEDIIEFAEIRDFIDSPVQSYSSGMAVRLGFAVATAMKPDVLILDEVLAVGDANFRSKCWRRIGELLKDTSVILVSHEAYMISRLCDRAILMDHGHSICDSSANDALAKYESIQISSGIPELFSTHPSISEAKIAKHTQNLEFGQSFKCQLFVEVKQPVSIDYAFINIADDHDQVHAQSYLSFPDSNLRVGKHLFNLEIGPLHLSKKRFAVNLLISTESGKIPLIHLRRQAKFSFDGLPNLGPTYYPPAIIMAEKSEPNF